MQNLTLKSAVTGLLLLGTVGLANAAGGGTDAHQSLNQMRGYTAQVGTGQLDMGRSVGYGNVWGTNIKLQEPVISPNGIPTLSDFAAHK